MRFSNTEENGVRQTDSGSPKHYSGDNVSMLTGHTEQQDTMGLEEEQMAKTLGWFSNAFLENTQKEKKSIPHTYDLFGCCTYYRGSLKLLACSTISGTKTMDCSLLETDKKQSCAPHGPDEC